MKSKEKDKKKKMKKKPGRNPNWGGQKIIQMTEEKIGNCGGVGSSYFQSSLFSKNGKEIERLFEGISRESK